MSDGTCARDACEEAGRWRVVLVFRAPAPHDDAPVVPGYLGITVCDAHKGSATLEDFLGDEGWEQIAGAFRIAGHVVPDRSRTSLDFIAVGSAEDLWATKGRSE